MDIKQTVESVIVEIELKKAEAERALEKAHELQEKAHDLLVEANEKSEAAEKKRKELAPFEATADKVKELEDWEERIIKDRQVNVEKHNSLVRWENNLVDIDTRLKLKETELKDKEAAQVKREAEYKEKLKTEFMEQLKKNLS